MFKRLLLSGWFCPQPWVKFLISLLLIAPTIVVPIHSVKASPVEAATSITTPWSIESALPLTVTPGVDEEIINELGTQNDPLDSPHPIPWNWVTTTQADVSSKSGSGVRYYRSQSIISPDGQYAAYSRIKMQVQPELYHSRVSSVLFVENLQTGELQVINAASPLTDNPLVEAEDADMPGIISILTPVGWSKTGDRLLARQFEGLFNSSDASDFAVVWYRTKNRTSTFAPSQTQYSHEISILLGWSQHDPKQLLFRAGNLGDEQWSLWAVASDGQTVAATDIDEPIVFGQRLNQVWSGPQVAYR